MKQNNQLPKLSNKVLFIGNGINNLTNENETSWVNLLHALRREVRNHDDSILLIKQFPLLFETLFLFGKNNGSIHKEIELKRIVADSVKGIIPNEIHKRITNLNPEHIITSNYDFVLENEENYEFNGILEEKRYSIFRRYTNAISKRNIWYVHGYCRAANTINLGFEHYSGQLQYLRNYVVSGTNYNKKEITEVPLVKRLDKISHEITSWVDLFFKEEIHIIGLSLDFVEIDLWWLLTYRARFISKSNKTIRNQIFYYIPQKFVKEAEGKIKMLESIGITVIKFTGENYNFYNQVMDFIERRN